jgi:hypothetical protein
MYKLLPSLVSSFSKNQYADKKVNVASFFYLMNIIEVHIDRIIVTLKYEKKLQHLFRRLCRLVMTYT